MTKRKTPQVDPVEQPSPAQPTPLPEVEGPAPEFEQRAEAAAPAVDPSQPVTMGMYMADIKTIITNQEALAHRIVELGGLKAQGKMPSPQRVESGQPQPQEPPAWLQSLLPVIMQIGQNIIAPGKAEPSTLDKVFNEYMERKKQAFAENIIKSLEAGEQGRLWIGDAPPTGKENSDPSGKVR